MADMAIALANVCFGPKSGHIMAVRHGMFHEYGPKSVIRRKTRHRQRVAISIFSRCGETGKRVTAPGRWSASSMGDAIAAPTGFLAPSPAAVAAGGLGG